MELTEADSGYAVLSVEPHIMRAQWLAGAIEAAGIPVHVEEDDLVDEFSMAKKLQGDLRVRVLVPADRLAEAQTVFLGLSQPIPLVDEDDEDDAELAAMGEALRTTTAMRVVLLLVLGTAGPVLLILLLDRVFNIL